MPSERPCGHGAQQCRQILMHERKTAFKCFFKK